MDTCYDRSDKLITLDVDSRVSKEFNVPLIYSFPNTLQVYFALTILVLLAVGAVVFKVFRPKTYSNI